jgi:hypothetical protein
LSEESFGYQSNLPTIAAVAASTSKPSEIAISAIKTLGTRDN